MQLVRLNQNLWKPGDPELIQKNLIYTLYNLKSSL